MREEFLTFMKSHPLYEEFMNEVLKHMPEVPSHNPEKDNTEQWKHASAMKAGFELCLTHLGVNYE